MANKITGVAESDVFKKWRTDVCARGGEPLTYREFGEVLGVSGQQARNYETGEQRPDPKILNAWYTSEDPRLFSLAIEIMTMRGRAYLEAERAAGRTALSLPAALVVRP